MGIFFDRRYPQKQTNMANTPQMSRDVDSGPANLIPQSFDTGFILLSYLVSFAGCATCLELLHRRTACVGYYNWYAILFRYVL